MDADGQVPCGAVGTELLRHDDRAAFGVALDASAVERAMLRCWRQRSVVLVEASDLPRTESYTPTVSTARLQEMWHAALVRTDQLVGRLLRHVDPTRDAVVLVAPSAPQIGAPHLHDVRGPHAGMRAGLLDSGVTRQAGFVSIVDVAPTIAALAGAPLAEEDIEGRAVSVARQGGDARQRIDFLVNADADAGFRDGVITPFTWTYVIAVLLFGLVAVLSLRFRRSWWVLEPIALGLIAIPPLTYWAALLPFRDWPTGAYYAFTFGLGFVIGFALSLMRRRGYLPAHDRAVVHGRDDRDQRGRARLAAPAEHRVRRFPCRRGTLLGRQQRDVLAADDRCAPARGVRRRAAPASSRWRRWRRCSLPSRSSTGRPCGAPMSAVCSRGIPAFALAFTLLAGWRVRVRTVFWWALGTIGVVVALGLLDLTRDASHRTHLGRLFERIGDQGSGGFTTVVNRKLDANLATLSHSVWRFTIVPIVLLALYVGWRMPERLAAVRERLPALIPCVIGIGAAAVLGYALNDSGIAVPGVMLSVFVPTMVFLLLRTPEPVESDV